MVCCDTWREGRRTGPVPGLAHARKTRPTNGGRPSGSTSPGHPDGLPSGVAAHTLGVMHNGTSGLWARSKGLPCCRGEAAPKPKNAVIPHPHRLRNRNGYDRAGSQGHHGHARRPERWCAAGFGTGLATRLTHGNRKSMGKKPVTLRTQIARAPSRPAAGPSATGAGSDARRDRCGCGLVIADEARPPRADAAWPPRMAPAGPQWLCT